MPTTLTLVTFWALNNGGILTGNQPYGRARLIPNLGNLEQGCLCHPIISARHPNAQIGQNTHHLG